jgi:hypothetical protein
VSKLVVTDGEMIAVDVAMLAAGMFADAARVTATVRVATFAACTAVGALSPEAALKVHASCAATAADVTVIVSVAVAVPELVSIELPVTPALPQVLPTSVNAIAAAEPARLGTTSTILSFTAIDTWGVNANDTADAELATVLEKVREVDNKDGNMIAVDAGIGTGGVLGFTTLGSFATLFKVTTTYLPALFTCAAFM